MKAHGSVFKYGDNVDTDVIIPARYLNSSDPKELAAHCMEDIDKEFVNQVKSGDLIVADKNLWCFQRTCPNCDQGGGCKLCHSRNICKNILS